MRYFLLLFCASIVCIANAQKNIHYTGSIEGGILKGSKPVSSFVFTTQGIAYKQYNFGAGTGIDYYPFRSVPLFIDVKRKFLNANTQPFVQASAGINFISKGSADAKLYHQYAAEGKFDNGYFAKGGAGLIFRAKKKLKIALSVGYTYKTTSYSYHTYIAIDPWTVPLQPLKDIYHYNRWSFGAGIIW